MNPFIDSMLPLNRQWSKPMNRLDRKIVSLYLVCPVYDLRGNSAGQRISSFISLGRKVPGLRQTIQCTKDQAIITLQQCITTWVLTHSVFGLHEYDGTIPMTITDSSF
jgi:hypothetical protein